MKRRTLTRWACLLALSTTSTPLLGPLSFAQGPDPLVMVISKSNASITSVTKADAKRIILGQMSTWTSGQKVVVVLRAQQNPDRVALLQMLCGMSEAEYTRYEMQVMFTGRAAAKVQEEPSSAAIKTYVKANPGAVGFLRMAELDKDLKAVLTVQ